ncbi:MAG: hypothetical protein GXX85_12990 [Ignavibacteria bacterium]|nr:hypothetical protein [Ignavibacteria bacterium]
MEFKDKILPEIEKAVQNAGLMLVDVIVRGKDNSRIIEIFVDGDDFVTTKVCADLSREIGEAFDKAELISSKYRLEVSSPGIGRPLKFLRQYKKNLDKHFEIEFAEENETKKIKGKLIEINGQVLVFGAGKEVIKIDFSNIKNAKVLIRF